MPETHTITPVELSMANNILPSYSGGSKDLAYFIKQAEKYIALLNIEGNDLFNSLILEQIQSKLTGPARDVVINNTCDTWVLLKNHLTQRFGDPRSEELLIHDLATSIQIHPQSYTEFHEEIQKKLQILKEHVAISSEDDTIINSKNSMYTQQALTVFKAGLLNPYRDHLLHISIKTLDEALYECRKLDNERSQIEFANFLRNQKSSKTRTNLQPGTSKTFPKNQINHQPFMHQPTRQFQYNNTAVYKPPKIPFRTH